MKINIIHFNFLNFNLNFILNLFKDINYLLNILAIGLSGLLCKFSMKTSEHVLLIIGFRSLKFTVEPFELILHHNTFNPYYFRR